MAATCGRRNSPGNRRCRAEAVDLPRQSDRALFDATMTFVHIGEAVQARLVRILKKVSISLRIVGRLALTAKR